MTLSPVVYRHVNGGWLATIDDRCPACGGTCRFNPMPLQKLRDGLRLEMPDRAELYFFQINTCKRCIGAVVVGTNWTCPDCGKLYTE